MNKDEILKRILLNMKYDSRKTLRENRNYMFNEQEKKPAITIDKPEFVGAYEDNTITELAPDGGKLILPAQVKILSRVTQLDRSKNFDKYCKLLINGDPEFKDITLEECNKKVFDKYKISHSKNSVSSFQHDGKTYKACYSLTDKSSVIIPLKNQKFFDNFSTSCDPPGEVWKYDPETTDKTEKNTQGSKTDGGYEDEEKITLDLSL